MDSSISLIANRVVDYRIGKWLFVTISRLGDFDFWLTLWLVFVSFREFRLIAHLFIVGFTGWAISRLLKISIARLRPYQSLPHLKVESTPLDNYSFPSAHVLVSTAFTITISSYHPELFLLLCMFTVLVSISRVVLGLHYLSDVIAGFLIGGILGTTLQNI